MPRVETQEDFNNRLKLDRLEKAKKHKELEDTIRKIVREELKSSYGLSELYETND